MKFEFYCVINNWDGVVMVSIVRGNFEYGWVVNLDVECFVDVLFM